MSASFKDYRAYVVAALLVLSLLFFFWRTVTSPTDIRDYQSIDQLKKIHMLLVGDPFALAIQNAAVQIEEASGFKVIIERVGYNDCRTLALLNSRGAVSKYDIVSFDVVWMGEYAKNSILLELNKWFDTFPALKEGDFIERAYQASSYAGKQYGIPIQPHAELLWCRRDLFEEAGIALPVTTDDALKAAAHFHSPDDNMYGICWNAQRGQALGQSVAHFYAAFGQPLIDSDGRPSLDTPRGLQVAQYLLELQKYSPPDILSMAWDLRVSRFSGGYAAMTYGWSGRSYLAEEDPYSRVSGKVEYIPAPHSADSIPVTPLGCWSLGIPANIADESRDAAVEFLAWIAGDDAQHIIALHGNGGIALHSLLQDAQLQRRFPALATINTLGQRGALDDSMRPAIPQWPRLAEILGTVFHDMLAGLIEPEEALRQAQSAAEKLFEGQVKD